MSQPGAKRNDRVVGLDTHFVIVPGPAVVPMPLPFDGALESELSATVLIDEEPAATRGSRARNAVAHVAPGGSFQRSPSNEAEITTGSSTVLFDEKPAARAGDTATTCNDPDDAPRGTVVATGTVLVGG